MGQMNKEISVFLLGKTEVLPNKLCDWLLDLGCSAETIKKLLDTDNTDATLLTALAAKQCYMSFEPGLNPNVTKTREDMTDYIDNVLAQGHGSVLEHVSWTFGINNCTRVLTGELNRHRAGVAISERSMRFIRFDEEMAWWLPTSLREQEGDDADLRLRKQATRRVFEGAFAEMHRNYEELCDIWDMDAEHHNFAYKKLMTSCFRRIVGMGACTGGVWTLNARALRHVLTMRCNMAAEEEIRLVGFLMLEIMRKSEPVLFGDFDAAGKPKYNKV